MKDVLNMNKALRKAIVAGNWKMNNDPGFIGGADYAADPMVKKDAACEVVCAYHTPSLETALSRCAGNPVVQKTSLGKIRRLHRRDAQMLAEMGVEYVIIGHFQARTVLW